MVPAIVFIVYLSCSKTGLNFSFCRGIQTYCLFQGGLFFSWLIWYFMHRIKIIVVLLVCKTSTKCDFSKRLGSRVERRERNVRKVVENILWRIMWVCVCNKIQILGVILHLASFPDVIGACAYITKNRKPSVWNVWLLQLTSELFKCLCTSYKS